MPGDEERFDGAVGAVRVGDTIRKPAGPWTPTVQAMLRHLRDAGFESVPEPLGLDDDGRETMSFVPGVSAARPWPEHLRTIDGVEVLAAWLRRFHHAIRGFRPADPVWRAGRMPIGEGEIALHGDLGPWNTVWDGDRLAGVIDWDLAEPGPPIVDVAFLAIQLVPLRDDAYAGRAGFAGEVPRTARLRRLCETYGDVTVDEVLDRVAWIHERDLRREREWGPRGVEPWATFRAHGDERIILADRAWLEANADAMRRP
jgi:Ser/Thr protein kinase RdoA (MazF antagonist)